MFKDIRSYLEFLEKKDYLSKVKDEIELAAIPSAIEQKEKEGRAVIFENIVGNKYRLYNNVFGRRDFLASVFDCPIEKVVDVFGSRIKERIKPVMVEDAPVQEVVLKDDNFDIRDLPFLIHSAKDGGRYVTGGIIIAKDPETGVRNLSYNRLQLKGPNKTGLRMSPTQDLEAYYRKAVAMNKPLEIAVVIGCDPMTMLAAACGPPRGVDELEIAGALAQEPIELVKCKTIDMEVPAHAEIVFEGEISPDPALAMEDEGPFGDFMEFYIEVAKNHVFDIKCVTMRKEPMIQAIFPGSTDDVTLLGSSREAQIKEVLESMNIDVRAINIMLCKNYLTCAISIKKQIDLEAKNALMAAFASFKFLKNCIIVDHDVDVFDPADVFWALSTRLRAEEGIMIVPNTAGFGRDNHGIHTTKLGIEATVPLDAWDEFERISVYKPEQGKVE